MRYSFFTFLITILLSFNLQAQDYPKKYFRSPIENRIFLSGTFGELRGGHFHAGLDIKTSGVEGAKVMAAADGWISRIKISPFGYGNCVYISHPNGYTTVYGHLQKILGKAGAYVKKQQYKQERFAVDLQINAHLFPVKKGQVVALSGNSGGSGGPHLHFEIRDSRTQEPLNPLLFGIPVKDYYTPQIRSIRVYPVGQGATVNQHTQPLNLATKGWGKTHRLKKADTLDIVGDFYLGVNTIDKQNDTHNKNGVYSIELRIDSNTVYRHRLERINFSTTRYINTLIDYPYYKEHKRRYQRTYQGTNNKLKIADLAQNNGIISLQDNKVHLVEYIVKDVPGNTSVLTFYVNALANDILQSPLNINIWKTNQAHVWNDEHVLVQVPSHAFYDTISFNVDLAEKGHPKTLSDTYIIGQAHRAMQKRATVTLKNIFLSDAEKNKAYVGRIDKKNISAYAIHWTGDDAKFKTRDMGKYAVFLDTVPPKITHIKRKKGSKSKRIKFKVQDKESGIKSYAAYLNNEWVLLIWDPKKKAMFYDVDKKIPPKSKFKIEVSDLVGNKQTKEISL